MARKGMAKKMAAKAVKSRGKAKAKGKDGMMMPGMPMKKMKKMSSMGY